MKTYTLILSILLAVAAVAFAHGAAAQQEQKPKDKAQGMSCGGQEMSGMKRRGDEQMGFSQDKATHHFRLSPDGGSIEIGANDAGDTVTRDQIRTHLAHIAQMFAEGDFNAPMLIHDQTPPGVPVMQRLKAEIKYRYEETPRGGRLRITTNSAEAREAIHQFLRFQIKEHQTGDSLEVTNS